MIISRLVLTLCLVAGHAWGQANPVFSPTGPDAAAYGREIIPRAWVQEATTPSAPFEAQGADERFSSLTLRRMRVLVCLATPPAVHTAGRPLARRGRQEFPET